MLHLGLNRIVSSLCALVTLILSSLDTSSIFILAASSSPHSEQCTQTIFKQLPDASFIASSTNKDFYPHLAKFQSDLDLKAWCPENRDDQFLEIDLLQIYLIKEIILDGYFSQGMNNQITKKLYIKYKRSFTQPWKTYSKTINGTYLLHGQEKIEKSKNISFNARTVIARYIRIYTKKVDNVEPCLRLRFHLCSISQIVSYQTPLPNVDSSSLLETLGYSDGRGGNDQPPSQLLSDALYDGDMQYGGSRHIMTGGLGKLVDNWPNTTTRTNKTRATFAISNFIGWSKSPDLTAVTVNLVFPNLRNVSAFMLGALNWRTSNTDDSMAMIGKINRIEISMSSSYQTEKEAASRSCTPTAATATVINAGAAICNKRAAACQRIVFKCSLVDAPVQQRVGTAMRLDIHFHGVYLLLDELTILSDETTEIRFKKALDFERKFRQQKSASSSSSLSSESSKNNKAVRINSETSTSSASDSSNDWSQNGYFLWIICASVLLLLLIVLGAAAFFIINKRKIRHKKRHYFEHHNVEGLCCSPDKFISVTPIIQSRGTAAAATAAAVVGRSIPGMGTALVSGSAGPVALSTPSHYPATLSAGAATATMPMDRKDSCPMLFPMSIMKPPPPPTHSHPPHHLHPHQHPQLHHHQHSHQHSQLHQLQLQPHPMPQSQPHHSSDQTFPGAAAASNTLCTSENLIKQVNDLDRNSIYSTVNSESLMGGGSSTIGTAGTGGVGGAAGGGGMAGNDNYASATLQSEQQQSLTSHAPPHHYPLSNPHTHAHSQTHKQALSHSMAMTPPNSHTHAHAQHIFSVSPLFSAVSHSQSHAHAHPHQAPSPYPPHHPYHQLLHQSAPPHLHAQMHTHTHAHTPLLSTAVTAASASSQPQPQNFQSSNLSLSSLMTSLAPPPKQHLILSGAVHIVNGNGPTHGDNADNATEHCETKKDGHPLISAGLASIAAPQPFSNAVTPFLL